MQHKYQKCNTMKKALIYALVVFLMVAFASCDKKETKQFLDQKALVEEIATLIDEAESCDDLSFAAFGFLALEVDDTEYAEDEKMTSDEEQQIEKMVEELSKKMEDKSLMMDCANQESTDEYGDFFDDYIDNEEPME